MPIDYKKYPPNWKKIRAQILERDGRKCLKCGVPNYSLVEDLDAGDRIVLSSPPHPVILEGIEPHSYGAARFAKDLIFDPDLGRKIIIVVLTIAHIRNHDPMDVRDENLAALCQRCHLRFDAAMHQKNSKETREKKKSIGLFTNK